MTPSKITVALPLKAEHVSETEDSESRPKIVKFAIVRKTEPDHAEPAELASFEQAMLPHLDAAHNLAKWLLRNEEDAKDVVQEAYLRAFRSFAGFLAPMVGLAAHNRPEYFLYPAKKDRVARSHHAF